MDKFMRIAYEEAMQSRAEGGIPVGAVLVHQDIVIGRGHNRRLQQGNPILHGEMDAIADAGRCPAEVYRSSVLYTTLAPCAMCSGAILLYGIPEVIVGEAVNFPGELALLRSRGVRVTVRNLPECIAMMKNYIAGHCEIWNEDIAR
ncbi:MAG: nucleoside deaminase [Victivallales bacterium]|nr:nucleoside deaminase [Victivallales bacterium]